MNPYAPKKGKTEWQWNYLTHDFIETATNASTLRVKLPVNEQISALEVELGAITHATGYTWTDMITDCIGQIEVIADGSKVLYSMSPETAQFIHLCTVFCPPKNRLAITGTSFQFMRVKIPFGRWLRDEDLMLDTGQYNNVYLEVPWALNVADWATNTFRHTTRFLRPIQRLSPTGFMRSRDIEFGAHNWTAAGHYLVDLPIEYPWYTLGFRAFEIVNPMTTNIPHVKLDIDDGRLVLVDDDLDDMMVDDCQYLPYPIHVHYQHNHTPAGWAHCQTLLGDYDEISGSLLGEDHGCINTNHYGQYIDYCVERDNGAMVDSRVNLTFHGNSFWCNQIIKHWWGGDPFPAKSHSSARIDFTHAIVNMTDLRTWLQEICPLKLA